MPCVLLTASGESSSLPAIATGREPAIFTNVSISVCAVGEFALKPSASSTHLRPASLRSAPTSFSVAPWKTGVFDSNPSTRPAHPRCVSKTWPTFIRDGTPSGLSTISTGVPSGRNGISSSGTIRAMIPLLPWRPAILSPTEIFRFSAT